MKSLKSIALITLWPALATAVPVKFNDCARSKPIRPVEGSTGAFYNADCTTIYVLPPQTGRISISGFQPDPDIQSRCEELDALSDDIANTTKTADLMSEQLLEIQKQISDLYKDLKQGLLPVGVTEEQVYQKIETLSDHQLKMRDKLETMRKQSVDERVTASNDEGGRAAFVMTTEYSQLLKAFQKANPGVAVERMPLDESYLSINTQTKDDKPPYGAVISLTPEGAKAMPPLPDPAALLDGKQRMPNQAPDGSLIFGDSLPGSLILSVPGACAIRQGTGGGIKSYISAGVTFAYQLQVRRDYKASLDLSELVRQIHEQTTSGGFFSTKTLDSFLDSRRSTEWVTFEDSAEDGRLQYTDDQIVELKKEFLDRALAEIVDLKTGQAGAVASLIAPGQNGADAAGDALSKCPHIYCQIGAAGLHVLSAIFGSESAVSDLTKQMSSRHEESMTSLRMVTEYGTYTFN